MRLLVAKATQVSHNIPRDLPTSRADYRDVDIRIVPRSRCCHE